MMTEPLDPFCALCHSKVDDPEEHFCFGCKCVVCEDCCTNFDMPFGLHEVDVHKLDEDEGW